MKIFNYLYYKIIYIIINHFVFVVLLSEDVEILFFCRALTELIDDELLLLIESFLLFEVFLF